MASSPDGITYLFENVGLATAPHSEGVAYLYENVGLAVAVHSEGVAYLYENVGDDLPSAEGWGWL